MKRYKEDIPIGFVEGFLSSSKRDESGLAGYLQGSFQVSSALRWALIRRFKGREFRSSGVLGVCGLRVARIWSCGTSGLRSAGHRSALGEGSSESLETKRCRA